MSQLKIKNGNNWESIPAGGIGVPSGGSSGQFLKKSSSVDYATEWGNVLTLHYKDLTINTSWTSLGLSTSDYAVVSIATLEATSMASFTITAYNGDWQAYANVGPYPARVYYVDLN